MGKKKSGKKGSKKGKKGDDEKDEKKVEMLKRLSAGYNKRLLKYGEQQPFEVVDTALKKAVKSGEDITQIVLIGQVLDPGIVNSSRLLPLLEAVRETGYPALREFFLWNTEIRNEDATPLATHLEKRADLTTIELLDNDLTTAGCMRIGTGLSFNKALTTLKISHNDIGDEGVLALCQGLAFNHVLQNLVLEFCGIGSDAGVALGRTVATSTGLTELLLNGNKVGSVGAIKMMIGIASSKALKRLELRNNHVDSYAPVGENCLALFEEMEALLANNITFAYLDLSDNYIGEEGGQAVLALYAARKEAGLSTVNIKVDARMRAETYAAIAKGTKWAEASGSGGGGKSKAKGSKKGGKKKGGKKKKKK